MSEPKNKGSQLQAAFILVFAGELPGKSLEIEPGAELEFAVIARVKGE